ncbi:MFS transporter [Kineosporia sp. NBRC 101731]|uniref:MFS transporter n=1 Tax=Kineosporia sp. NBRC 101731 TaxID=3032199 RepID=UPI00249F997D|nr:MFS transporter [Kineosporia sp. NBRC 101731]GLY27037.1 MFS transporter [Kineosporia sp. NBRC 101731]
MSATTVTRTSFDRTLIAPLIIGAVLNPINSSIIAVALIPIGRALHASPSETAWLVSSLYLATAIGQPVVGRLVDMFGPRNLYLAGALFTAIAGLIGTFAPNLGFLVVARVILGLGTCAGYPAAMYLIRSESRRTGQDSPAGILTMLSVASQTILVVGPTLGGLLIGLGGWRSTFTLNIPLGLACLVLALLYLPKNAQLDEKTDHSLDLPGIALFAGTLIALLLFLMEPDTSLLYLLVIAAVAAVAFVIRERRTGDPFVDLRVLAGNRPLVVTYLRSMLAALISYCFLYGYTQWLEDGRGLSASQTGLVLLPLFGVGILVSTLTGRRAEIRMKLLVGAISQVAVCFLLLLLNDHSPIWLLLVITVLLGVPQGLVNLANQNAVYHQAEPARIASSAGLLRTFVYLGAILSSVASGALLGDAAGSSGLHHLAVFMIAVGLLGTVLVLPDRSLAAVGTTTDHPDQQER